MRKEGTMKRKFTPGMSLGFMIALLILAVLPFAGCATLGMEKEKPKDVIATDRGTVIYRDKYEFKLPPLGWSLMKNLEGGDWEMGFFKMEPGEFPSQTTFMYDDQPYGSSRDLEQRAKQYCLRFLFNSGIEEDIESQVRTQVVGLPALAISMEGENPNRGEKAKSKIYLVQKGNRIISFVCTQWRPINGTYDPAPFEQFEDFLGSFKFLQKTFYEDFEEKLQEEGL